MRHSTPVKTLPSEERLAFLRAFARLYSPLTDNEAEARRMASAIAKAAILPS